MANGLPANAPRPTTPGATPRQRRRHFSSPRIMTMTEKIARLTLCRFSRESLFGLNASPNPRQRLSPLETAIAQKRSGTVSESASERHGGAVKNSGELGQIVIDFTGDFAILLALHRTFQVAERQWKSARRIVPGARSEMRIVLKGQRIIHWRFQRLFRTQMVCRDESSHNVAG